MLNQKEHTTLHNAAFVFFHPDCTVGIGISPILSIKKDSRAVTADRGISPHPEDLYQIYQEYVKSQAELVVDFWQSDGAKPPHRAGLRQDITC
jgi:hypothetical protein